MKTYKVKTKFIFSGHFNIKAESEQHAKELVLEHCGLVLGSSIHCSLPDDIVNWEFKTHPKKKVS